MGGASSKSDNEVSGAEAVTTGLKTYSDKKIKNLKPADYDEEKDDTLAKLEVFKTAGATKLENQKLIGATGILKGGFQKGSIKTRTFFIDKVLESDKAKKNIGYTKDEFSKLSSAKQEEVYKGYLGKRTSNTTDAYGNPIGGSGGNDNYNQPILTSAAETLPANNIPAPTNAEVTQAGSTTMSADEILVANKKKGRVETIMTSASGLGESNILNTKKKKLGV